MQAMRKRLGFRREIVDHRSPKADLSSAIKYEVRLDRYTRLLLYVLPFVLSSLSLVLNAYAMGIFSYVKSIYALDTIDTRFTSSSSIPYKTVIDARDDPATSGSKRDDSVPGLGVKTDRHGRPVAQPSKWKTPEFYFYYFVFITIVPYMFWIAYDVSRPSDPNYHKYQHLLSPDAQYFTFRRNLPYLGLLLVFHPLLRKLYNFLRPLSIRNNSPRLNGSSYVSAAEGEARMEQRASFDFIFAFIFLTALHGFSVVKIVIILYMNYCIATRVPRKYMPAASWIFNIGMLFANELAEGYSMAKITAYLWPLEVAGLQSDNSMVSWGQWLDSRSGIMPRWQIPFNLTMLRLVSFNLDLYWSLDPRGGSPLEVGLLTLNAIFSY
ncbi:hypothetical protein G7Y89_g15569 [Cudoniella acicularis]|uniref:Uncharacterized protein n=1 Tax=Cudoniella acicularis TaxID=354080 RepID=A0A8H4QKX4_9HELO|nr:hypothetical protein G7Y89_g15569 [Cudoniella acicularis]